MEQFFLLNILQIYTSKLRDLPKKKCNFICRSNYLHTDLIIQKSKKLSLTQHNNIFSSHKEVLEKFVSSLQSKLYSKNIFCKDEKLKKKMDFKKELSFSEEKKLMSPGIGFSAQFQFARCLTIVQSFSVAISQDLVQKKYRFQKITVRVAKDLFLNNGFVLSVHIFSSLSFHSFYFVSHFVSHKNKDVFITKRAMCYLFFFSI